MNNIRIEVPGITKLLRNLNSHKASGPDGVPARLLKETAEEIAPAISILFPGLSRPGFCTICMEEGAGTSSLQKRE